MGRALSRQEASDAVGELGWRFVLGTLRASVPVESLTVAADRIAWLIGLCGEDAGEHLRVNLRADRIVLTLRSLEQSALTSRDVELAQLISAALREAGLHTEPRLVQLLEIAVDAMDIAAIRPFWKAVLGYVDETPGGGPADPIVDPVGQAPAIWFQQLDAPRPQRNRIHLDISVPHDEAPPRIEAALAAGGRLLSAASAPAFWVLADPEGNEACVSTWQGR